jgi:transcriptional regulator with XRE-family HTH domain
MTFGEFIRLKRDAAGIPLNDFARQIGISPAYWSRIERNLEKPPKDELISKAAHLLGLTLDEAFIQASRLPPDMQTKVGEVVQAFRRLPKTEN